MALAAAIGASHARALRALAKGDDPREVVPDEAAKSVGAEDTFGEDSSGAPRSSASSSRRRPASGRRLRAAGLAGHVVTLKVKYADFTLVTRRETLARPTDDDRAIFETARAQLARVDSRGRCGSRASRSPGSRARAERGQLDLFHAERAPRAEVEKRRALNAALDVLARPVRRRCGHTSGPRGRRRRLTGPTRRPRCPARPRWDTHRASGARRSPPTSLERPSIESAVGRSPCPLS